MPDYDSIHDEILSGISNEWQKSQGFITYDITKAMAIAIASLSNDIDIAESKFFVDNLSGDELAVFIYEHRGLSRKEGSPARATLVLLNGRGHVSKGDLFTTDTGETFASIGDYDLEMGDEWVVESVGTGERYNVEAGTIVKYPITIEGILEFTNLNAADGGSDEESDAALIERYKDDLLYPNNGSNKQAYISWAESVPGVGRVKVFPQPQGRANTVEVCVTDAAYTAPDTSTIMAVQDYIDPNQNGDGSGTAPIGAKCIVTGASELSVNLTAKVVLDGAESLSDVKIKVEEMLTEYLGSIAFKRLDADRYQTYVSAAIIGSKLIAIDGVADYSDLKINGSSSSVNLGDKQVPVKGTVTLTEA